MPTGSDIGICRNGPRHRRVYYLHELEHPTFGDYRDTGEFRRLDTIYRWGVPKELKDATVRVFEWTGSEEELAEAARRRRATGVECLFLGCTERAVKRISGDYDAPWQGCAVHFPGMADTFKIGRPDTYYVRVEAC